MRATGRRNKIELEENMLWVNQAGKQHMRNNSTTCMFANLMSVRAENKQTKNKNI